MTWGTDDQQFVSLCDGMGWFKDQKVYYNSRLFAIEGGPRDASFHDVAAYPDLIPERRGDPLYYAFGTLAVDGRLYQLLSLARPPQQKNGATGFRGIKLIHSPDQGRTWRNQDGSTPVLWEPWDQQSSDAMLFFEEPQDAFNMVSIAQMGRDYAHNRDGYIYFYGPNGSGEDQFNQLVLCRAPKHRVLDRGYYEYFAGYKASSVARWSKNIADRAIILTFPRIKDCSAYSWLPSVTYNAPLQRFLMANWGWALKENPQDGSSGPSYLGFWTASTPWGPWRQIHEETAWTPGGDSNARCYQPQIAPKWIGQDGQSFWLVWSDFQSVSRQAQEELKEKLLHHPPATREDYSRLALEFARNHPCYQFNIQRVDLVI